MPNATKSNEAINRKKYNELFSEVLLLSLLTAGAYWVAYKFELGYLNFYGFTPDFIQIRIENILIAAGAVLSSFALPFIVINLLSPFVPKNPLLRWKFIRILGFLFILIFFASLYGVANNYWILYLVAFGLIVLFEIVWPILVFSKEGSISSRFIADEKAEEKNRARLLINRIAGFIPPIFYLLILSVFLLGTLANIIGMTQAQNRKEYFETDNQKNVAIVRINGDSMLGVSYDPKTKKILEQVSIQYIDSKDIILLKNKKVGKLIPKK